MSAPTDPPEPADESAPDPADASGRSLESASLLGARVGRFRLLREIGAGGMGTVYLAQVLDQRFDPEESVSLRALLSPGMRVAVKVIHGHLVNSSVAFERFAREARIGRRVRHENVVRTYDAQTERVSGTGVHYIVMEFVEGQTLRTLLRQLTHLPEELCRHVGRELSKGLGAIHAAGAVHRDVKPENVLIVGDEIVKLMDLGAAHVMDELVRLSETGQFVGSVLYAAPEQFQGAGITVDLRADLYALGLLLYELATGVHPFQADDLRVAMRRQLEEQPKRLSRLNPQITPFFEEVVHRLLNKDPACRFQTAAELLEVLTLGEEGSWWRGRASEIRTRTRRPLRRVRVPRETRIHGRDDELTALRQLFDRVEQGDGQVVLVEGEAGVGKTRLVDEFVAQLVDEGRDVNFLFGAYPPGGAATASSAVSAAFRDHLGAENLDKTLETYLPSTPVLIPAFAALLRGEPPPPEHERLTKDSLQTVFTQATRMLAAKRPTLILIDDLHFAPEEGLALFATLLLAVPASRVMLVGTFRPGRLPSDWIANVERGDHATRLPVGRLGPKFLARLLVEAFGSERLAKELAFGIAEKSDGNPFFVFEIVRGLREGGYLARRQDGTWARTRTIENIEIPSSVHDLVYARMAYVSDEDKELLDVAACCGYTFDAALVAEALEIPRVPVLRRLAFLEARHRLLRSTGAMFRFDHHQVQEILYDRLPEGLRCEYHAVLGEALLRRLEKGDGDCVDGQAAVALCRHLLLGDRSTQAMEFLDSALRHLEGSYRHAAAIELVDAALDAPGLVSGAARVDLLLRRVRRLSFLGRREQELDSLNEALTAADETADPVLRARTRGLLGWHHVSVSQYEEARGWLAASLELARASEDRREIAATTGSLGRVMAALGRYEDARDLHSEHLRIAEAIGYDEGRAMALGSLGHVAWALGSYEDARGHFQRDLAISADIPDRRGVGIATCNVGRVAEALGRFEEAVESFERSLIVASEIGYRQGEGVALSHLGRLYGVLGDTNHSRECLDSAGTVFREIGARYREGLAQFGQALLREQLGMTSDAIELHDQALALRRAIHDRAGVVESLVALGALHETAGRTQEARECLDEALVKALRIERADSVVLAAAHLAVLPPAPADDGPADDGPADDGPADDGPTDELARSLLKEYGPRAHLRSVMEAHWLLYRATGSAEDRSRAITLLGQLRENAPARYQETMIDRVPLHAEIQGAGL